MADFFFFTDIDLLNSQTISQAFGPDSSNPSEDYRVTSLFSSISSSNAYAVCDGVILVQQNSDNPSLVNLILKPLEQSELRYATVKYYVYSGIKLTSLINGTETANRLNNNLTAHIWESQDAFNNTNNTTDNPSSSALGIHLNSTSNAPNQFNDTDYIYDAFERINDTFQLPIVKGGWSLGKFEETGFGFQIITSRNSFEPTFEIARSSEVIINSILDSSSASEVFLSNEIRERILNFIDPVAMYGLFYLNGVKAKLDSSSNDFVMLKNEDLFDNLLSKFYTNDILYIDIRNEHNHSLNHYQNYNTGINITIDNGPLTNVSYDDGNAWPILSLNNSLFNSLNNTGNIKLNLPEGDNEYPLVYLRQGFYKHSFPSTIDKFQDLTFNSGFTNDIDLTIFKHTSTNHIIPSYLNLTYFKKFTNFPNTTVSSAALTLTNEHFIDYLFDLNNLFNSSGQISQFSKFSDNTKWKVSDNEPLVDILAGYPNYYIAKTLVAEDLTSIYFCAYDNGENLKDGSIDIPLPQFGLSEKTDFISDILVDYQSEEFEIFNFEIPLSSGSAEAIESNVLNDPQEIAKLTPSNSSLIILCLTKSTDLPLLVTATQQFSGDRPKWLCIRNYMLKQDVNGVPYYEGDIYVTGHEEVGSIVTVKSVNTNIKFSLPNG